MSGILVTSRPMAPKYLDHLRAVPLFKASSRKDLEKIARAADEVDVEEGRVLTKEGEVGHEAFVIIDGQAAVSQGGKQVATLGPGEPFGEMALLDRAPRNATVTAVTPMKLLVVGQREFGGLMDESPGFARPILAAMASRLREKDVSLYG